MVDLINLRPTSFDQYIGQDQVLTTLQIFLDAIKKRGKPSEHVLFYGPPGIGKTTLSHLIARELGSELKITSGPAVGRIGDLAAIVTNLKDNDVLFIDEIHRLPKPVEEVLYPVMEDYTLDLVVGKGPAARAMRLPVARIIIVAATTKIALLSAPLRDRFGLVLRLNYYKPHELEQIIKRSADLLNLEITSEAIKRIASRSRGTPRLANRLLKRASDILAVRTYKQVDNELLDELFDLLDIDELGLTDLDHRYLGLLANKYQNSPVGVETIALSLTEDVRTVEEFIEPYLLQLGFIKKTPRGRVLTPSAYAHIVKRTTQ